VKRRRKDSWAEEKDRRVRGKAPFGKQSGAEKKKKKKDSWSLFHGLAAWPGRASSDVKKKIDEENSIKPFKNQILLPPSVVSGEKLNGPMTFLQIEK